MFEIVFDRGVLFCPGVHGFEFCRSVENVEIHPFEATPQKRRAADLDQRRHVERTLFFGLSVARMHVVHHGKLRERQICGSVFGQFQHARSHLEIFHADAFGQND